MDWLMGNLARLALRGMVFMGMMQALRSPESTALVVEYARTSIAYFGWLLMNSMAA